MDLKQSIGGLLNKDIDRGEFLRHIGFALLALFGVTRFVKSLQKPQAQASVRATGYGQTINLKRR